MTNTLMSNRFYRVPGFNDYLERNCTKLQRRVFEIIQARAYSHSHKAAISWLTFAESLGRKTHVYTWKGIDRVVCNSKDIKQAVKRLYAIGLISKEGEWNNNYPYSNAPNVFELTTLKVVNGYLTLHLPPQL